MEADRLLFHTLRDLEQRTAATDEYELLMSAALLRKLLLDEEPLMDQVNRRYRLKVRFRIGGVSHMEQFIYDQLPGPIFWAAEDALDPDAGLSPSLDANRDRFLGRRIMRFGGEWITVRDVIVQLAHVEGAVHSGTAKDQRQRVIQEASKFYSINGLPGVVSQVRRIGRITVLGLTPLLDAVVASGAAASASIGRDGSVELRNGVDASGPP